MFQVILNNFQKKNWVKGHARGNFVFQFLAVSSLLSLFWIFPIFGKINLMGGGQKSLFVILPKGVRHAEPWISFVKGQGEIFLPF